MKCELSTGNVPETKPLINVLQKCVLNVFTMNLPSDLHPTLHRFHFNRHSFF